MMRFVKPQNNDRLLYVHSLLDAQFRTLNWLKWIYQLGAPFYWLWSSSKCLLINVYSSLYLILNIEMENQKRFPFREGNKFNFKCFHLCYLDWQARVLFSLWICAQVDVKFHFLWTSYHSGQLNIVLVENSTIQTIRKWILTNGVVFVAQHLK